MDCNTLDYYKIGQRIRSFRKACGLSQEQLAEAVRISPTHMSHIETGNTKLSLPVLVGIAETLEVQADALLYGQPHITRTSLTDEIAGVLDSCPFHDMLILLDTLKAVKVSLEKYRDAEMDNVD